MADNKLWSDEFEQDLKDLRNTIKTHTWAHDKWASKFRILGIVYNVIVTVLGLLVPAGVSILEAYAPTWTLLYAKTMGVALGFVSGMRIYFDPDTMRTNHIIASNAKGDIADKIKLQLNIPREERTWRADDFYQYIFDKFGTVSSSTPYLSSELLAGYPKINKLNTPNLQVQEMMEVIKKKHT